MVAVILTYLYTSVPAFGLPFVLPAVFTSGIIEMFLIWNIRNLLVNRKLKKLEKGIIKYNDKTSRFIITVEFIATILSIILTFTKGNIIYNMCGISIALTILAILSIIYLLYTIYYLNNLNNLKNQNNFNDIKNIE